MVKSLWPWLKSKRNAHRQPAEPWALSTPLLKVSDGDQLNIGHAVEGTLILGATGSGKSSGSGRTMALAYLNAGFGGLVLCAKPDERQQWETYCRQTGRLDDLVIFNPKEKWRFNPVDFERNRAGEGAGLTENLLNLIETMEHACDPERGKKSGGGNNEKFFNDANKQLTRNAIEGVGWGTGHVTIPALYRFITSMPKTKADLNSEEWRENSFCVECLAEGHKKPKTPQQEEEFSDLKDYFFREWIKFPDRTQESIVATFTTAADPLRRGMLRTLFGGETNIDPTATEQGRIIVVDLPVLEYGDIGRFAQILWKYPFQKAIARRTIQNSPRPVFLWQDEAQLFLIENDYGFQSLCRSFRVATVMLSQNISNFYAVLGGEEAGRSQADSLFGNLKFKVFHCNGDSKTNTFAAETIGRTSRFMVSANLNHQANDFFTSMAGTGTTNSSAGVSEQIQFEVEPSVFTGLRTGGPQNKFLLDAILFFDGMKFKATGRQWRPVTFSQK